MKNNPQIHIYLTVHLHTLLKQRAGEYGLSPAQYLRFILVKDLDGYFRDLSIGNPGPHEKVRVQQEFFNEKKEA